MAYAMTSEVYCQRGQAENRIKEQQLGLFADRTSCHPFDFAQDKDFVANQFRALCLLRLIS
jgi:hypothetical protein